MKLQNFGVLAERGYNGQQFSVRRLVCWVGCFAAIAICQLLSGASANAQAPGANRKAFNFKGALLDMQRGVMKVQDAADKKEYLVKLPNELEQIRYSGQAATEWLSGGMFVRFDTQMDEKGKILNPVKQLEVFMPDPKLPNNPELMKDNVPGVHLNGVPDSEKLFNDEVKKIVVKSYRVVGRVGGLNKGKLMVIAGSNRLQVDLDPQVIVNVSVPGVDLCQQGDDISVNGFTYPEQPGWVEAQRVQITGKQPVGQKPQKPTRASRVKRDSKEPKVDAADDKAAAKGDSGK